MLEDGGGQRIGDLQPGDILLFAGKGLLARLVNWVQALRAADRASEYNHAALVTSADGDIFHAVRWRIRYTCLKNRGRRSRVMLVRWRKMTPARFRLGMAAVAPMEGRIFPLWRQLFHALNLARIICVGRWAVCSELVAKFLHAAGARHRHWAGTNVDDLHDEFVGRPSQYEVIYRGRWGDFFRKS